MSKTREAYERTVAAMRDRLKTSPSTFLHEGNTNDGLGKFATCTRYFTSLAEAQAVILEWLDVANEFRLMVDFSSYEIGEGSDWACSLTMSGCRRPFDAQDVASAAVAS